MIMSCFFLVVELLGSVYFGWKSWGVLDSSWMLSVLIFFPLEIFVEILLFQFHEFKRLWPRLLKHVLYC